MRVGLQLERFGDDETTIIGGFGHDLFEDTDVTLDLFGELFGSAATDLVLACSHDVELYKQDPDAANNDLIQRAEAHGSSAIAVKIVDVTDNLATAHEVPKDWVEEMFGCGQQWLQLGHRYLGDDTPHCKALTERLLETERLTK